MSVFIYLIKTRRNFTSSFLDQNNLKSKNELIYIKYFKSFKQFVYLNLIKHSRSFLKQYSIYAL